MLGFDFDFAETWDEWWFRALGGQPAVQRYTSEMVVSLVFIFLSKWSMAYRSAWLRTDRHLAMADIFWVESLSSGAVYHHYFLYSFTRIAFIFSPLYVHKSVGTFSLEDSNDRVGKDDTISVQSNILLEHGHTNDFLLTGISWCKRQILKRS